MRAAQWRKIFDVLGCAGALQLHLPSTKFTLRYLVGSQALVFLSVIRNGLCSCKQKTWDNADIRLTPLDYYKRELNNQIAIRELGEFGILTIPWDISNKKLR